MSKEKITIDRHVSREIECDCIQIVHRFYDYLDARRYEDLAELFSANGSWTRLRKRLEGPAAIRREMAERGEAWLTAHVVTNVLVDVEDIDRARTSQYITLYRHENWDISKGPPPVVLPIAVLHHRDRMLREAGVWKIEEKTSRPIMVNEARANYHRGA